MDTGLLIDTNIFLEILLRQDRGELAFRVLETARKKYLTDFTFHRISVIAFKNSIPADKLNSFIKLIRKSHEIIKIKDSDVIKIYNLAIENNLDFDDAQILFTARKYKLKIVSFDKHFLKFKPYVLDPKDLI